jgi:hypothetical protein
MAVIIPRTLAEYILLGPTGDRRQLQDSPILGDVWIAFASYPGPQELLITPHKTKAAGTVAICIDDRKAHQEMVEHWSDSKSARPTAIRSTLDRFAALAGIILWAFESDVQIGPNDSSAPTCLAAAIKDKKRD